MNSIQGTLSLDGRVSVTFVLRLVLTLTSSCLGSGCRSKCLCPTTAEVGILSPQAGSRKKRGSSSTSF